MISNVRISDKRYRLEKGAGSDAVHHNPVYSYAVTTLIDDSGIEGTGLAFTLGKGNELVCQAAAFFSKALVGQDIEELMSRFGAVFNAFANDPQLRWIGPHKGVVHLALASATNACYDLWAKKRGVPLWKLLTDLSPEELVNTLDFSGLEDELTAAEAIEMLGQCRGGKASREGILRHGYTGYDTSVGWFGYSDEKVRENAKMAMAAGFTALKLKVGSDDIERDIRRANIVREVVGDQVRLMVDANQQWSLPKAISVCSRLRAVLPYWIEEPIHPDDIIGHQRLAQMVTPMKIAAGEHVPNRVVFKNYLQAGALGFVQVDAVRVGGVSEFITVSLLSKKFGVPVVPHVGDMGQLHQHLVLFNHISVDHEHIFLEHIPHLKDHFVHPIVMDGGTYKTPMEPGSSCDLKG